MARTSVVLTSMFGFLMFAAMATAAPKSPPNIVDLDGAVMLVSISRTEYDLSNGSKTSVRIAETWTLTQTDTETVHIVSDSSVTGEFNAHYESGVLTFGYVNDPSLAIVTYCGYLVVLGSPGKLSFKGELAAYDVLSAYLLRVETVSGKQAKPGPLALEKMETASAKVTIPPSIDDIVGTWAISDKWMEYTFGESKPEKGSSKDLFVITKTSDTEVLLVWYATDDTWEYRAHYYNGVLLIGTGNVGPDPGNYVETMYLEFSGTPGKLKVRGKYLWYQWYDFGGGLVDVEALSGKQVFLP